MNRRTPFILAALAALLPSNPMYAGEAPHFAPRSKTASVPAHAKAGSGVLGKFTATGLAAPSFSVTLPSGRTVTARQVHINRMAGRNAVTWTGSIPGGGSLTLSLHKGALTGVLVDGAEVYEIAPKGDGQHLLFAVDRARLKLADPIVAAPIKESDTASAKAAPLVGLLAADDAPVIQDVMIAYTAAAAARFGATQLEGMALNAIAAANTAYRQSNVGITLNLVDLGPTDVVEGSGMDGTLESARKSSALQAQRNAVGADLVAVLSADVSNYCGMAYVMGRMSATSESAAYSVVAPHCLSSQTLAHELGHNQGLVHDRDTSPDGGGITPYAYGFRRCGVEGAARDIMSYGCTTGYAPRVDYFSNPRITVYGHPFGVDIAIDPTRAADGARALNETAPYVAAYRSGPSAPPTPPPPPTPPAAPTSLTGASAGPTRVELTWKDASTDEAGFALERSSDGVTFAEIALLGADTVAFEDATVESNIPYTYRVFSFNSIGRSDASNAVTVTAVLPLPGAPPIVTTVNNRKRNATVRWGAATGAPVARYDVQRESWTKVTERVLVGTKYKNVKTYQWTGARIVGTTDGTIHSMVDMAGIGSFRYSVRAANASGASGWTYGGTVKVTK